MKRIYTIIILATVKLALSSNAFAQWTIQSSQVTENLNSICMIRPGVGWIVGDNGTMLYMSRGAWTESVRITNEDLHSVCLTDPYNGWAVGSKGVILRLKEGKWQSVTSPTGNTLYSVSFIDSDNGAAVGTNGTVAVYANGNWKMAEKFSRGHLFAVSAGKEYSLMGGGLESMSINVMDVPGLPSKGHVKSLDPEFRIIKGIARQSETIIWAVGMPGAIFCFNGRSWKREEYLEKIPSLTGIAFSNDKNGVAVGYHGTILTYSGGRWEKEASPLSIKLNGASAMGNIFYAVGNNGAIITSHRDKELIGESSYDDIYGLKIESFPNPSTSELKIVMPAEIRYSSALITVTNAYGQIFFKKTFSFVNPGELIEINTSNLSSGLYLITFSTPEGQNGTGKFVVKR